MKKILVLFLLSFSFISLNAQTLDVWQINHFVNKQLKMYPESTLQDLYKSYFQDIYGPEHLVTDTNAVLNYIDKEITADYNEAYPIYEHCGLNGNFIRVNISNIKEGYLDKENLAYAFIQSANLERKMPIKEFKQSWDEIVQYIIDNNISLANFQQDTAYINKLTAEGRYAWVHSRTFHDIYKPHYRIISKQLFEQKIYPKIKNALKNL